MVSKLILSVFSLCVLVNSGNIPDYIKVCKRSDPQLTQCVMDSIEHLRPQLKKGIPEINVPGLEPLFIKEVTIVRGQNNNFRAALKDVNVYGASNFKINKLKLNVPRLTFRVDITIPTLYMEGIYDIDAKILVVPIKADCGGQGILKGELITDDKGVRHLKFTTFTFAISIGDYSIQLDNLFNGDPTLSQAVNDVLHQNKKELIGAAIPFINRKAAEILLEMANGITYSVNYDEIFPE
ncbi:hypothetical protein WA026_000741 [Henosepilachna vigintioctopunctata]|uniref:Uncharacterized protein n=1 Tax=Henosepilachna vigintioctopunctata TaxID=420089 RepID=A0AAW1V1D7_9CUCU